MDQTFVIAARSSIHLTVHSFIMRQVVLCAPSSYGILSLAGASQQHTVGIIGNDLNIFF